MNDRPEDGLKQQLDEAVAAIWERRRDQVMERIDVLMKTAEMLRNGEGTEAMAGAKEEAHRLIGSLGSFGFDEGSVMAADIERLLLSVSSDPDWIDRLESKVAELNTYMKTK